LVKGSQNVLHDAPRPPVPPGGSGTLVNFRHKPLHDAAGLPFATLNQA
jgi:hypothetical protein